MTRRRTWSIVAKLLGAGMVALGMQMCIASLGVEKPGWDNGAAVALAAFTLLLELSLAAAVFWLAWRLWRRWSAGTVRIVAGAAAALLGLCLMRLFDHVIDGKDRIHDHWLMDVLNVPALVLAAVLYRKLSRGVIRWADLDDPLDVHGNPVGHVDRVKAFCVLLGVGVWLASTGISRELTRMGRDNRGIIVFWVGIVLAWGMYRMTLAWMTPVTKEALAAGSGFDVLPAGREDC